MVTTPWSHNDSPPATSVDSARKAAALEDRAWFGDRQSGFRRGRLVPLEQAQRRSDDLARAAETAGFLPVADEGILLRGDRDGEGFAAGQARPYP